MGLQRLRTYGHLLGRVVASTTFCVLTASTVLAATNAANPVTETHTETQRSLLGGFWTHSTSTTTTTTPRSLSLNDVETGTLLFRTEQPGRYIEAPRVDTNVSIDVTGMVARVVVVQSFTNPSSQWLEGVYAFPLPEDSAVDALKMRIGDKVINGEIMEKAQARKAYERARQDGTRASMVEQSRPNLFKTSVANIAPLDTVNIEISYLETLRYDEGQFSLRFPLAITPRYDPSALSAGMLASVSPLPDNLLSGESVRKVSMPDVVPVSTVRPSLAEISVRLDAGFPLKSLVSDSHEIDVREHQSMHYLTLKDVAVSMDRDFELRWQPKVGAHPGAAIFTEELEGSTYAKIMFMPPQSQSEIVSLPRETVIVVDTSGSMAGASFDQAIKAVNAALNMLSENDYFNILEFNNDHTGVFARPQPATQENLNRARRFLRRLSAGGGTNMAPPVAEALMRESGLELLKQIVFITDGAVSNEDELFGLIHQELGRARFFTVGIGAAPNSYFMRKAAETGRGTYTYISSTRQVGVRMQNLFRKLKSPVLKDIEIAWPGRQTDVTPVIIPDLYLSEPLVVSAKLDGPADSIEISAAQAGKRWSRKLDIGAGLEFRGVSTLWARDKVGMLMDGLVRGEAAENVRAKVVPLALHHHLVTRYTSLVALDDLPARFDWAPQNSAGSAAVNSSGAQQLHYPRTATTAPQKMLTGLVLLMLAAFARKMAMPS